MQLLCRNLAFMSFLPLYAAQQSENCLLWNLIPFIHHVPVWWSNLFILFCVNNSWWLHMLVNTMSFLSHWLGSSGVTGGVFCIFVTIYFLCIWMGTKIWLVATYCGIGFLSFLLSLDLLVDWLLWFPSQDISPLFLYWCCSGW